MKEKKSKIYMSTGWTFCQRTFAFVRISKHIFSIFLYFFFFLKTPLGMYANNLRPLSEQTNPMMFGRKLRDIWSMNCFICFKNIFAWYSASWLLSLSILPRLLQICMQHSGHKHQIWNQDSEFKSRPRTLHSFLHK